MLAVLNLLDGSFLASVVSQLQFYYVDVMSGFDNEVASASRKHVFYLACRGFPAKSIRSLLPFFQVQA